MGVLDGLRHSRPVKSLAERFFFLNPHSNIVLTEEKHEISTYNIHVLHMYNMYILQDFNYSNQSQSTKYLNLFLY